jgi:hypothetical protein
MCSLVQPVAKEREERILEARRVLQKNHHENELKCALQPTRASNFA